MAKKKTLAAIHYEVGHTEEEWSSRFGDNDFVQFWSFPLEELFDGTIEPDDSIVYWYINGRLYETDIEWE